MTKRTSSMATTTLDSSFSTLHELTNRQTLHHPVVVEEINGLIRVYRDGHVDRPQVVPCVTCSLPPELGIISRDVVIDKYTGIWARFYVPIKFQQKKLPLMVYFHGGGFCVGSASWSCYHEFLAKLASRTRCVIVSVNYRLAPENPLPAAYDDGVKVLVWLGQKNHEFFPFNEWWSGKIDFSRVFLGGDSAGANIAYNVALRVNRPFCIKGLVLMQPFFGGEARTRSEECMAQPKGSVLTVAAADTYWRLSLPAGANRDHPWCKGAAAGVEELRRLPPLMVCVAEMDILKDRNLEMCGRLVGGGVRVETVVYGGVGHAFQILDKSALAQTRAHELICRINNFLNG